MKFCEDILKGFQVIEQTHFYGKMRRKIIPRELTQELWFMCSALRLVLIHVCLKFTEAILNRSLLTEQTGN